LERIGRQVSAASALLVGGLGVDGRDTAAQVARRCGVSSREARKRVRVAKVTQSLPAAGEALALGAVSAEHMEILAPVADRPGADELVALAVVQSPEELRRTVLEFEMAGDDGAELAEKQRRARSLSFFDGPYGMVGMRGLLPPVEGAMLRNTLQRLADEKWRADHPERAKTLGAHGGEPFERRLADALVELMHRANGRGAGVGSECDPGYRPAVVLTLDVETLAGEVVGQGPVPFSEVMRFAEQAELYAMVRDQHGAVVNFGRNRRLASPLQRLAVIVRDRHCQYPGCDASYLRSAVHHLREWDADHGSTDLDNLVLLCAQHHQHLHRSGELLEREHDGRIRIGYRPGRSPPGTAA
jgi:hypothetical protein